jgi:hypothetical protein
VIERLPLFLEDVNNRRRLHSALGQLPLEEYEALDAQTAAYVNPGGSTCPLCGVTPEEPADVVVLCRRCHSAAHGRTLPAHPSSKPGPIRIGEFSMAFFDWAAARPDGLSGWCVWGPSLRPPEGNPWCFRSNRPGVPGHYRIL